MGRIVNGKDKDFPNTFYIDTPSKRTKNYTGKNCLAQNIVESFFLGIFVFPVSTHTF